MHLAYTWPMCSVVRVMSVENVYIITCTQTYCMNWDWLE